MIAHILCLLLGLCGVVSGQSLIGVSMPCEETDIDPDVNNPMDNLICPFTNETCITTSQICDCVNVATSSGSVSGSGSGSGSGSKLFSEEYDEGFGIHSIDCSKSHNTTMCNGKIRESACERILARTLEARARRMYNVFFGFIDS